MDDHSIGRQLNVSDFDFELPGDLIAQQPPSERGASRLLRAREILREYGFALPGD